MPTPHRAVTAIYGAITVTPTTTQIHVVLPTFAPVLDTPGLAWNLSDPTHTFTGSIPNGATSFDITPDAAVLDGTGSYQLTITGGAFDFNPTTTDSIDLVVTGVTLDPTPGPATVDVDLALANALPGQHQTQYLYDVTAPKPAAVAGATVDLVGAAGFWTGGPEGSWTDSDVVTAGLDYTTCNDCYDSFQKLAQPTRSTDGTTLQIVLPTVLYAGRLTALDFIQIAAGDPSRNSPDVIVNVHLSLTGGLQRLQLKTAVTISGIHAVGVRQVAMPGTWRPAAYGAWPAEPVTFTYQWYRNGVAIPKATGRTYLPVSTDYGRYVSVRVRAHQPGYLDALAYSARIKIALHAPLRPTTLPAMLGTPRVGRTLTASHGTWTPTATSYRYQWLRDGKAVVGATRSYLTLTSSWKGHKVSLRVTALRSGYAPGSRTTAAKTVA